MNRPAIILAAVIMAGILIASVPSAQAKYVINQMEVYNSADYSLQVSAPHHNQTLGSGQTYWATIGTWGNDVVTMKINGAFVKAIPSGVMDIESFKAQASGWVNMTFENATGIKLSLSWKSGYDIISVPNQDWIDWLNNYTKRNAPPPNSIVVDLTIPFAGLGILLATAAFIIIMSGVYVYRTKSKETTHQIAKSTDPAGPLSEGWQGVTGHPKEPSVAMIKDGEGMK